MVTDAKTSRHLSMEWVGSMLKRIFFCLALLLTSVNSAVANGNASAEIARMAIAFCPGPACNQDIPERILLFDVDAALNPDGSMDVTEKIRVLVRGELMRHGIYRSLPLQWNRRDGQLYQAEYRLQQILRDGQPEFYQKDGDDKSLTLYIGDPNRTLLPGVHEYVIRYQVSNHFSRYKSWDELYWNVTGSDWTFTIDKVRFSLTLPDNGGVIRIGHDPRINSVDYYTGESNSRGGSAEILYDDSIVTTEPLPPLHGLTVVYTWPRSVLPLVAESAADVAPGAQLLYALLPERGHWLHWVPFLLLCLYALGKFFTRPRPAPARESFRSGRPPEMSPGYMRYVMQRTCDEKVFAADVLNTVVKQAVEVRENADNPQEQALHAINGRNSFGPQMQDSDCLLRDALFGDDRRPVVLRGEHSPRLARIRSLLAAFYHGSREKLLYRTGWPLFWGHVAILLTFLTCAMAYDLNEMFRVFVLYLSTLLFLRPFMRIVSRFIPGEQEEKRWRALPFLLGIVLFQTAVIVALYWLMGSIDFLLLPAGFVGALIGCLVLSYAYYAFMPVYTREGEDQLAQVMEMKGYLLDAADNPESLAHDADELMALSRRILPYALALNCGTQWENAVEQCARRLDGDAAGVIQANDRCVSLFLNLCSAVRTETETERKRHKVTIATGTA